MCCFSAPVEDVSGTKIFARASGGEQLVAYQMRFAAAGEVAMVLPVPTPAGSAESAVRFLDLSEYPWLFSDLASAFASTGSIGAAPAARSLEDGAVERLEVHDVGAFEASFVPSPRDFVRLDPRFRLSPEVLAALPKYADWGFVVFKLRSAGKGATEVHPMAFRFPTRAPGEVFFPCVHVHDGEVHAQARFDHSLYAQLESGLAPRPTAGNAWIRSGGVLSEFADAGRAQGLLDGGALAFRVELSGLLPNDDVWASAVPESQADAEVRALSRARAEEARALRERWHAEARRQEIRGRLVRGVVGTPISAALGFLLYIALLAHFDGDPHGRPSTIVFALAWLPSLWVVVQAASGRARWAWIGSGVAAVAVAAAFLAGGR